MHPRISLHQVVLITEDTPTFIRHCKSLGVENATVVSIPLVMLGALEPALEALAETGVRATTINHPFATYPNLEDDSGEASAKLLQAIDLAERLGADSIYMQTGGRGSLSWEQAVERFTDLLEPGKAAAKERGIRLTTENASAFNVDIHSAHTLADTILLAELSGIGLVIDLQPCWAEASLSKLFRRAMPITNLIQVSDYVLGDRVAPCRAVPGDGAIPLERLIGDLLEAGFEGLFDLELVGPRIDAEGGRSASARAVEWLSNTLTRLGA